MPARRPLGEIFASSERRSLGTIFGRDRAARSTAGILERDPLTGALRPRPIVGGKLAITPEPQEESSPLDFALARGLKERAKLVGAGIAEGAAGIARLSTPGLMASAVTGRNPILGEGVGPIGALERAARSTAESAAERHAELGEAAGIPGPLTTGLGVGARVAGIMADVLPAGRLGRMGRAVAAPVTRAAGQAGAEVAPDLLALQRASEAFGQATPSGRLPVREIAREGNRLRALGEAGDELGSLDLLPEPGGGFRVGLVETGKRGSGVGRALMRRAAEETAGPYRGAAAETTEGSGFLTRLRETDPDLFAPSSAEAGHVEMGGFARWAEENLTSGGPFRVAAREQATPEAAEFVRTIPKRLEAMHGRHQGAMQDLERLQRDLNLAVKDAAGRGQNVEGIYDRLTKVRLGEADASTLPPGVWERASKIGALIDDLSESGVEAGSIPPALAETIRGNLGRYLHRAYRAFDDPQWLGKVEGSEAWSNAYAFLRKELPDAPETEIEGIMRQLATRRDVGEWMRVMTVPGGPRSINAILQKRQAIAPELRALMGESTDFREVAERTVHNLAWDTETYRFFKEVGDDGLAAGAFRPKEHPTREVYMKLGAEGQGDLGSRYPVGELLASPGLKRALEGSFEEVRDSAWRQLTGWVKAGKTVGSVQTQARNFLSHTLTTVAQGRLPFMPGRTRQAVEIMRGVSPAKTRRAVELGVMREGATAREVEDYVRMLEGAGGSRLVQPFAVAGKKLAKLYRASDDFWRNYNWIGETEDLMKAKGLALPEAEALAADRVRDTVQTYGRAPLIAQKLRRNPLVGAFPTFYIESVRNVGNLARIAARDLREGIQTGNQALVKLGMRRYLGMASAALSAGATAAAFRQQGGGVSKEQEGAYRELVAPAYHRNAELIFKEMKPGESVTAFDWSFLNPYSALLRPVVATQRAIEEGKAPVEAVTEFLEQVAGGEILATTLGEIVANRRLQRLYPPQWAGPIYNADLGGERMAKDVGYELYRSLAPGAVVTAENIGRGAGLIPSERDGRQYSVGQEALAVVGPRVTTYQIPQALRRRGGDVAKRLRSVVADAKQQARNGAPPAEQAEALVTNWRGVYADLLAGVRSAQTLGMEPRAIMATLGDLGVSKRIIHAALAGREEPMFFFEPATLEEAALLRALHTAQAPKAGMR